MIPEKITCGMRMSGIKLVARSLFGASAESANPVIKPANEASAREMYISRTGGRKILCSNGAFRLTKITTTRLCRRHNTPKTLIFENM